MSRPLRIEYKGALYHVMNRGNQHQVVFKQQADYAVFLKKLEHFADLFCIDIYCYCLMQNHFHLLLRTRDANLSRFMQSFLTSFTVTLNRRNQKSGHLFQGRFKAQLVENRKYLSELSRYIHLNPVRVKKYEKVSVVEKKNILENYNWSSFGAHVGLKEKAHYLDIRPVLSSWGRTNNDKMKKYRKYVEDGLYKNIDNPFDLALRQQIIGSETFAEKLIREKILTKTIKDSREERELIKLQKSIKANAVIDAVAQYFNTDKKNILTRRSNLKRARKLAMYLCCRYCTNNRSLTEIGKLFNVSISGVTNSRNRISEEIARKKELKMILEDLIKCIVKV